MVFLKNFFIINNHIANTFRAELGWDDHLQVTGEEGIPQPFVNQNMSANDSAREHSVALPILSGLQSMSVPENQTDPSAQYVVQSQGVAGSVGSVSQPNLCSGTMYYTLSSQNQNMANPVYSQLNQSQGASSFVSQSQQGLFQQQVTPNQSNQIMQNTISQSGQMFHQQPSINPSQAGIQMQATAPHMNQYVAMPSRQVKDQGARPKYMNTPLQQTQQVYILLAMFAENLLFIDKASIPTRSIKCYIQLKLKLS